MQFHVLMSALESVASSTTVSISTSAIDLCVKIKSVRARGWGSLPREEKII
jgi:hypothetical protein